MPGIKNNRRTQFTIATIKETFIEMLSEKEFAAITVTDICKSADINRGTFYLHFKDTVDLFTKIETELFLQISPLLIMQPTESLYDWLHRFVVLIQKNATISQVIFADYQNSSVLEQIFALVKDTAKKEFQIVFQEDNPEALNYYFTYFVSGTIQTLSTWLIHGQDTLSSAEITQVLTKILSTSTSQSSYDSSGL
ncbi:MAG: TetR/AcrR family transcriptional regulator [Enterococcus sp.]